MFQKEFCGFLKSIPSTLQIVLTWARITSVFGISLRHRRDVKVLSSPQCMHMIPHHPCGAWLQWQLAGHISWSPWFITKKVKWVFALFLINFFNPDQHFDWKRQPKVEMWARRRLVGLRIEWALNQPLSTLSGGKAVLLALDHQCQFYINKYLRTLLWVVHQEIWQMLTALSYLSKSCETVYSIQAWKLTDLGRD